MFEPTESKPFEIDFKTLPPTDIYSLPLRGEYRLFHVGVTASIAIDTVEQARLAKALNAEDSSNMIKDIAAKKGYFVVKRTPLSAEIASFLESKGLPVEKLRKQLDGIDIPLEENEYLSERLGVVDVQTALNQASDNERQGILNSYGDGLGQMYRNGVIYGANHLGNMIYHDGTVYFIDFKTAQYLNIDWNTATADSLYKTFMPDWSYLIYLSLENAGCSHEEINSVFEQIVVGMPINEKIKKELLGLIRSYMD